jgi:OOP family OmpA-OmpF porin
MAIFKWRNSPAPTERDEAASLPAEKTGEPDSAEEPEPGPAIVAASAARPGPAGLSLEERLLAKVAGVGSSAPPPAAVDLPPSSKVPAAEPEDSLADDPDFTRLRRLLLGRETDGLAELRRQLTDPDLRARDLSQVITEALLIRTQKDQKLDPVLRDTVERILSGLVRRNPADLADSLFPVMGPAIRRSVTESLRGMLQDFSRVLEKSFSLTGLRWRLTALRTGQPFSEVVFLNTLEYQVEQVFLVHTATGTPLLHLLNEGIVAKDAGGDQVAAMFTALQHFVSDSFSEGKLSTLTFGDSEIFVTQTQEIFLACVVRGQAPPQLRADMRTVLELLTIELAEELEHFNGDVESFQTARRFLEDLLISRFKNENRKLSFSAFLLPVFIFAVIAGSLSYLGWSMARTREENRKLAQLELAENRLETEIYEKAVGPGLAPVHVVTSRTGRWEITFLKDELAPSPEPILAGLGLTPDRVRIVYLPYLSQDPELVARRVALILADQPPGFSHRFDWTTSTLILGGTAPLAWALTVYDRLSSVPGIRAVWISGLTDSETGVTADLGSDRLLRLKGQASLGWLENLRDKVLAGPGLGGLDTLELSDDPASRRIKELITGLDRVVILFPLDQDQPIEGDRPKLFQAADDLVELERLAAPMGLTVSLGVYGYTDPSGSAKRNYELSQARARTLAALLYQRGSTIPIATHGLGPDPAAAPQARGRPDAGQISRRIELKVKLDRARLTPDPS